MNVSDTFVNLGAVLLTALLGYYFFGPKNRREAVVEDGVQNITITVKGGYSPDVIQVVRGVPVRINFDRQESGDCSSRVLFPDFRINQSLPADRVTTIEFTPEESGEYAFACGMNMLHGRLVVVESDVVQARGEATTRELVPEGTLVVRSGYHPADVTVEAGRPTTLFVDRQEDSP